MGTLDMLDQVEAQPERKSDVIQVPVGRDVEEKAREYLLFKSNMEDWKNKTDEAKADLTRMVYPFFLCVCAKGSIPSSIKLGEAELLFVVQNRYPKLALKLEPELRTVFGADYDTFISKERVYELDISKLTPELTEQLVAAKVLKNKSFLKPTALFHDRLLTDERVRAKAKEVGLEPVSYPMEPKQKGG